MYLETVGILFAVILATPVSELMADGRRWTGEKYVRVARKCSES